MHSAANNTPPSSQPTVDENQGRAAAFRVRFANATGGDDYIVIHPRYHVKPHVYNAIYVLFMFRLNRPNVTKHALPIPADFSNNVSQ
jgi:hypothetical protein